MTHEPLVRVPDASVCPSSPSVGEISLATDAAETGIEIETELHRLAALPRGPGCATAEPVLAQLARQLAVRGELRARYHARWRIDASAPPLPRALWPKLVSVLLEAARLDGPTRDRGAAGRNLDAAWRALALWRRAESASADRLTVRVAGDRAAAGEIALCTESARRLTAAFVGSVPAPAAPRGTPWLVSYAARGVTAAALTGASRDPHASHPGPAHAGRGITSAGGLGSGATLPLVVLGQEGPQARAYLSVLQAVGLRVARILWIVDAPPARTPWTRWVPGRWRLAWAERAQALREHHWPRRLLLRRRLMDSLAEGLASIVPDAGALFARLVQGFRVDAHAPHVQRVPRSDWHDPRLAQALAACAPATVLYTGGGLVPRALLALDGLTFLHVHPGTLPEVRGADGLLWSLLIHGRPGMSCFRMAPGIDTGALLARGEGPPLRFRLDARTELTDADAYRALFSFVDPLLRAVFLRDIVLPTTASFTDLSATEQPLGAGRTYHFLSPELRAAALRLLFVRA